MWVTISLIWRVCYVVLCDHIVCVMNVHMPSQFALFLGYLCVMNVHMPLQFSLFPWIFSFLQVKLLEPFLFSLKLFASWHAIVSFCNWCFAWSWSTKAGHKSIFDLIGLKLFMYFFLSSWLYDKVVFLTINHIVCLHTPDVNLTWEKNSSGLRVIFLDQMSHLINAHELTSVKVHLGLTCSWMRVHFTV